MEFRLAEIEGHRQGGLLRIKDGSLKSRHPVISSVR